jgi:hypothetical protein
MGDISSRTDLLDHVPPAGAALDRQLHWTAVRSRSEVLAQPTTEPGPVRRRDPTTPVLSGLAHNRVEGDLGAMQIEPTYDAHEGPPRCSSRDGKQQVRLFPRRLLPRSCPRQGSESSGQGSKPSSPQPQRPRCDRRLTPTLPKRSTRQQWTRREGGRPQPAPARRPRSARTNGPLPSCQPHPAATQPERSHRPVATTLSHMGC